MMYYRSTAEMTDHFTGWTVIKNELVTDRERDKRFPNLPDYIFTRVKINSRDTYKTFGIRFQCHERTRKSDRAYFDTLNEMEEATA